MGEGQGRAAQDGGLGHPGDIDKRYAGEKMPVEKIIAQIDWGRFIREIVGVTIPVFWIPAHTITFLLPGQYRVLFAASLSIVLGLILSLAKMRNLKSSNIKQ